MRRRVTNARMCTSLSRKRCRPRSSTRQRTVWLNSSGVRLAMGVALACGRGACQSHRGALAAGVLTCCGADVRTWVVRRTGIACAVLLALAAGGCGTRQGRGGAPTATATPAAVLRVATSGDYAPFSLVNADGEFTGMDVEIAARLASDLGMQLALTRFTWAELDAAV